MSSDSCPDPQVLRAFCLGDLSESQLDSIAKHLVSCATCKSRHKNIADDLVGQKIDKVLTLPEPPTDTSLPQIDGFKLVKEIGRGGMGVVYEARDCELPRTVALKVIRQDLPRNDPQFVERFKREAAAVAALEHDNIVTVYKAGENNGLHYLSMKYVDGRPLSKLLPLELPDLEAGRVMTVARAVHFAHEQGVIHRDLKPDNILLTKEGKPLVADFGLAKPIDNNDGRLTKTGHFMGSPSYMAPEQVVGKYITELVDVYGLGAILYERLTGKPPFSGTTVVEVLEMVKNPQVEPVRPRKFNPRIPRELETICLKCLEKNPERRYGDAAQVADELERWLRGEPIKARPAGPGRRLQKWVYRNPYVTVLGVVLLLAILGSYIAYVQIGLRQRAEKAEEESRGLNTLLVTDQGVNALSRGNPTAAVFHLVNALKLTPDALAARQHYLRTAISSTYDSIHRLEDMCLLPGEIRAAAASLDGRLIAFVDASGLLQLHDLVTGTRRAKLIRPAVLPKNNTALSLGAVSFMPDNKSLVAAAEGEADGGPIYFVDLDTLSSRLLCKFPGRPRALSIDRDGNNVVVGGIGANNAKSSLVTYSIATGNAANPSFSVDGQVDAVAFSADGRYFATSGRWTNSLEVWDLWEQDPLTKERKMAIKPIPHPGRIFALAFSVDGSKVITGCIDGGIRFWDTKTGTADGSILRHSHPVRALAYHHGGEGHYLLSGAEDGTARVWDVGLRAPLGQPLYHVGNVRGVAFCSYAGITRFVTTGFDRVARVWRFQPGTSAVLRHPAGVAAIAFSEDGSYVVTGCRDSTNEKGSVRLWARSEFGQTTFLRKFEQEGEALAVGVGRDVILGAGNDGSARLWKFNGTPERPLLSHTARNVVYSASISKDGRYVAFAGQGRSIHLLDRETGEHREWTGPDTGWVWTAAISPDGTRLLTDGRSGIRLWDVRTSKLLADKMCLPGDDEVKWSTFNSKGTRVLGCGFSTGQAAIWDVQGTLPIPFGTRFAP